jgi:hypothetical protein
MARPPAGPLLPLSPAATPEVVTVEAAEVEVIEEEVVGGGGGGCGGWMLMGTTEDVGLLPVCLFDVEPAHGPL